MTGVLNVRTGGAWVPVATHVPPPNYRVFASTAARDTWTDRPDGALAYTPEYGGVVWRWNTIANKWLFQQVESWVTANMNDAVSIPNTSDTPATFQAVSGKNWILGSAGRLRCQVPGPNLYQVNINCVTRGSSGGAYVQVTLKIQNSTTVLGTITSVQGIHFWTGQTISAVCTFNLNDDITVYGATDSTGTVWDSRSTVTAHFLGPKT